MAQSAVRNGRLVLDEATDLPEGAEIELVPADWWADLDDDERRRPEESLAQSQEDVEAGQVVPAATGLDRLRRR